jgi:hypothetical protein
VNLTRLPLFFPERREFFLEGSSFFDFGRDGGRTVTLFFSRQIGLSAARTPQKIDYGAKLTGQIGAYDLGVLRVRTGAEKGSAGEDFIVVRSRRRLFNESYVGMMYTLRHTRESALENRQTAGADFSLEASKFRGNQNLLFTGYYL